jgi:hypothetical protein
MNWPKLVGPNELAQMAHSLQGKFWKFESTKKGSTIRSLSPKFLRLFASLANETSLVIRIDLAERF